MSWLGHCFGGEVNQREPRHILTVDESDRASRPGDSILSRPPSSIGQMVMKPAQSEGQDRFHQITSEGSSIMEQENEKANLP